MIWLPGYVASRLHSLACDEITQSHNVALNEIITKKVNKSQWEARFVAHLCRAMSGVATAWGKELAAAKTGFGLKMATVFTHQSPCVKWKSATTNERCELADVLLAIIDCTAGVPKGVAMLVQAKLSANGSITLSSKSERTQFDLFSTRPVFDVDTLPAPKGIDLGHLTPDSSLIYGLTGPSAVPLPNSFSWPHYWLIADHLGLAAGSYAATGKDCLVYKLVGMLLGSSGWQFKLPPKGSDWRYFEGVNQRDDWATLINYLLEQTFAKPLSVAQSISMGRPFRGQEDVVHLATTNTLGQRMFFIGHGMADSTTVRYFGGGRETDTDDWQVVNPSEGPAFDGGGGSADGGEQLVADEPPEGGPVSVILFEVGG